jgi:hypothetical protein
MTIVDYFRERYGQRLVHLDLPCFIMQPVERNIFIPMEVSEIKLIVIGSKLRGAS